jgi:hypothetical protein
MAPSGRLAETHWQYRLAVVQRLDLGFFVHTQNYGVLRRRDVKADDVADLGYEVRIGRELELLHPMRLEPEGSSDALHRRHRKSVRSKRAPFGSLESFLLINHKGFGYRT